MLSLVLREQYIGTAPVHSHVALLITPELYHYQSYKQRRNWITIIRLLRQVAEKESHRHHPLRWELVVDDNCFSRDGPAGIDADVAE